MYIIFRISYPWYYWHFWTTWGCAGGNLYAGALDIHGKPNGKVSYLLAPIQAWWLSIGSQWPESWEVKFQGPGFLGDISQKKFVGSPKIGIEVERGFTTLRDPKGLLLWNIRYPFPFAGRALLLGFRRLRCGHFLAGHEADRSFGSLLEPMVENGAKGCIIYTVNCIGHRARFAMRVPWVPCHILSHVWSPQRERRCVTAMQRCHLFTRWNEMSPWRENILNLYRLQIFPIRRHDVC